jgi:hypothetical protein
MERRSPAKIVSDMICALELAIVKFTSLRMKLITMGNGGEEFYFYDNSARYKFQVVRK